MIELFGFFFIIILGTLSHFLYEWSHHNKIFAIFFAANESTWEHIKLAIGPTFLWILIEIPFIELNNNFLLAKLVSLLTMIILIPTLFYLYRAILKKNVFILNILEFVISIALAQIFSYMVYNATPVSSVVCYISLILIDIILVAYLTFTCLPPKNILFKDPINNKYGIDAHMDYKDYKKLHK
jgi:hypothetical protein